MKAIAQFIHLFMRVVFKIILVGTILIVAAPFAYFTWRANQPMDLPQFDGRTYLDWLTARHSAYADLAQQYRQSHPKKEVKDEMCFSTELGMQLIAAFPNSGFYALAGLFPSLQSYTNAQD